MGKSLKDYGIDPHELTEGEAANLASELLTKHDLPHKIWVRGDVESELLDVIAGGDQALGGIPPHVFDAVVDGAWSSRHVKDLSDCVESDWDMIRYAISTAAEELGVRL